MLIKEQASLIAPYGEKLVDLMVSAESHDELKSYASQLPSIQISPSAVCDLEMLAIGAYSPLDRFMGKEDYERVLVDMSLENGYLFPMPITLPVNDHNELHLDCDVAIRNNEFELMAIMTIEEIFCWDRERYVDEVLGKRDLRHPLRTEIQRWGSINISGRIQVLQLQRHYDFRDLWLTPYQTRAKLNQFASQNVVAVQPNSSMLPNLGEIDTEELEEFAGRVLLQLAVGMPKPGDYEYFNQVRTYRDSAKEYLEPGKFLISLQPFSTRLSGPREALLQALIQRNYGANYLYPGGNYRNHTNSNNDEVYNVFTKFIHKLEMKTLSSRKPGEQDNSRSNGKSKSSQDGRLSGQHRTTYPKYVDETPLVKFQKDVLEKLDGAQPVPNGRGVCIWFTGLSGSGKSTTAEILSWLILEHDRRITVLDGDVVRTHLSKGLSFTKEDRDTNVRRIGFVASELVGLGGVVICAVVSPYREARQDVRNMVGHDSYVEVFVDTPLEVCEERDVKGLYAKARSGKLKDFTGFDDPYEPPLHPEITLDTVNCTPEENAQSIINYLSERGFIHSDKSHKNTIKLGERHE